MRGIREVPVPAQVTSTILYLQRARWSGACRAPREMDETRRGGGARGDVFIRGNGKPEIAIGLGLEEFAPVRLALRTASDHNVVTAGQQ
jgi:hypothetical protein